MSTLPNSTHDASWPLPAAAAELAARWTATDAIRATALLTVPLTLMVRSNQLLIAIRDGTVQRWIGDSLLVYLANACMLIAIGSVVILAERHAPVRAGWRIAWLGAAVAVAGFLCGVCYVLVWARINRIDLWAESELPLLGVMSFGARYGFIALAFCVVREIHRRLTALVEATHRAESDRIVIESELAEARLQALQAQVEPHFLFNTLANVRRLYQTDRPTGRAMLDNLQRYLEVALPHMRSESSTLGQELALTEAFLQVHRIRMGHRLAFSISAPEVLRSVRVPSMMLLTLVENAIKHGLNPLVAGGSIAVVARHEIDPAGGRLVISVRDNGRGFDPDDIGSGTGLANIRARLAATRDQRARLDLATNLPHGVIATLTLPCDDMPATVRPRIADAPTTVPA